jgi:FMN phosphatase YigB (HAD superfamily)
MDRNNITLKEKFKRRNLQSIIFDLDSTLLDTNPHFLNKIEQASIRLVKELFSKEDSHQQNNRVKELLELAHTTYKQLANPVLINELTLKAVRIYADQEGIEYSKEKDLKIESLLNNFYKDFYNTSPELYPGTLKILNTVQKMHIPFGIYSHAQKNWTDIKVEYIKEKYIHCFNEKIEIPYFTTLIEDKKDKEGWIEAAKYFGFKLETTLVVGDSWTSDIQPAIEAGYKNLIHISNLKIENQNPKVNIVTTNNIFHIFDNL